jgi:hypothetical protein
MDLARPADEAELARLLDRYAATAPPLLRRDFAHSLRAAYRTEEVEAQLASLGLADWSVAMVSDRHWAVRGRVGAR